jgi:probable rRNA maturation factor
MTIDLTNNSGTLIKEDEIISLMEFAMNFMELNPECELNVSFVDEKEMAELHVEWMNLPGPTDVLSFPMDLPSKKGEAVTLGDIIIAPTVAALQAKTAGHSTEHEISILATHGLLHILGYDHEDIDEEKVMFALQESIVEKWEKK